MNNKPNEHAAEASDWEARELGRTQGNIDGTVRTELGEQNWENRQQNHQ